jgi:SAM domain (Sterile alpha motif)
MDVGVRLRSLGLRQYEATFRDNEIDGAVLPKLTVDGACQSNSGRLRMADTSSRRRLPTPQAPATPPMQQSVFACSPAG